MLMCSVADDGSLASCEENADDYAGPAYCYDIAACVIPSSVIECNNSDENYDDIANNRNSVISNTKFQGC